MNSSLKLDWCSHEAARYAVMNWHYSKALPACKLIKIGVWENKQFIGCIIYGLGANPYLHRPYGLKKTEVCELVRVALNNHNNPVTKMVSISLKMLKRKCPDLKVVVSFADMNQGHEGVIYKAGNWIETGIAKSTDLYWHNGRWMHQRQIGSLGMTTKNWKGKKKKQLNKYRFIYILDKNIKEKIQASLV